MTYVPQTSFGNTFTTPTGTDNFVSSVQTLGGIDYTSLNRRRFSDSVQFSSFYKIVKDFVLARLGAPIVRVELSEFQILTAIDEAVTKLDYHAPNWCTNYMTFITKGGENVYELPKFVMNNLQYVVYKKTLLSVAAHENSLEFDFFTKYFQDNFLFKDFSVADFLIMTSHLEQIRKILSRDGTFEVVDGQKLFVYPIPQMPEEVIVQFRTLNSDTLHPYFLNWLQKFSVSICKVILGGIRGKYDMLPSPGGGARLNGQALTAEGNAEQEKLVEDLLLEIEEPPAFTTF
tara:strand:+ start:317 stop:1180 length:864 start_codon:yes stop_codon:yes gene_type:complete